MKKVIIVGLIASTVLLTSCTGEGKNAKTFESDYEVISESREQNRESKYNLSLSEGYPPFSQDGKTAYFVGITHPIENVTLYFNGDIVGSVTSQSNGNYQVEIDAPSKSGKIEAKSSNETIEIEYLPPKNINSDDTEKQVTIFGLNEEAVIADSSNNPMYSLKIINATTSLNRADDFYTKGKPDNTIQITYEYKNINFEKPIKINSQFISAFNSSGLAGDTLSIMDGQTEVDKGRSAQSTIYIVMDTVMLDANEIEIDYTNDFSLGFNNSLKFKVPLSH